MQFHQLRVAPIRVSIPPARFSLRDKIYSRVTRALNACRYILATPLHKRVYEMQLLPIPVALQSNIES